MTPIRHRRIPHRLRRRLRALFRRDEVERDMSEELRLHIEMETDHLMRTRELSRAEATRLAHVAFGGLTRFEERTRDARGVRPLEELLRDIGLAVRTLRRSPAFAVVAVLTLALGIGAVTALFGVVNRIVLQPLPYADADRLVAVTHRAQGLGLEETGLSSGTYFHYREHARELETLALFSEEALNLAGDDGAERIQVTAADPEFFRLLGVRPTLGRLYTEADWTGTALDLNWTIPVLLSHEFWQHRFGGDASIVGRILSINDTPREVVGVLPPGFAFPRKGTQVWRMHMPIDEAGADFAGWLGYSAIGRLRQGSTVAEAAAELVRILPAIEGVYRDATPARIAQAQIAPVVIPLKEAVVGETGRALWILFGGMAFLLLVACANVANLFLVRAETQAREVAVRTALGAGRLAIARLFLAESIVLSAVGAAAGLALAALALHALVVWSPVDLPRLDEVRLDGWAVLVTAGITLAAALVFGLLSLLRHTRSTALMSALKGAGVAGVGRTRRRVLDGLVAAQVALTLALLAGSALMAASYARLTAVDPGYRAAGVLTVDIGVPYSKAMRHRELYEAVAERMRRVPGVTSVGGASSLPLAGGADEQPLRAAETDARSGRASAPVAFRFFVPGYFQTLETGIVDGVGFAPGERTLHEYPVVISEALARRLYPGQRAVGRRVYRLDRDGGPVSMYRMEGGTRTAVALPPYTIAGVVRDMRDATLHARGGEAIYIPVIEPRVEQSIMSTQMSFVLRSDLPPLSLAGAARSAVYDVDPALSITRIRTFEDVVAASTAMERFLAVLLLVASTTSLLLGAVGIYGTAAYAVRRRRPEIGVRVALGATPAAVTRLVVGESLAVVLAGAAAGVVAALAGARALQSMLFEVSPGDPLVLAGATVLLIAVALAASLLPARRAAATDPTIALRAD